MHLTTVHVEGGPDPVPAFVREMTKAMAGRGITGRDSDAFEASRDVIFAEAAAAIGCEWDIDPLDAENVRLWPVGTVVDWDAMAEPEGA